METNQGSNGGAEVFKLSPSDINFVFRSSGLVGNTLSPFSYDSEAAAVASPSEYFQAFQQDALFRGSAGKLLEPDLKVSFSTGGSGAQEDTYSVLMKKEDPSVLAVMENSEGGYLLLHFAEKNAFLQWWVSVYGMNSNASYRQVFDSVKPLEVLVYALHSVDTYRRAYMESMLSYNSEVSLAIGNVGFLDSMKQALASQDSRWLLPTLFKLCPALTRAKLKLLPEHIRAAEEAGFITLHNDENSGDMIVTLGDKAQSMGTEFLKTWIVATAIEAAIYTDGNMRRVSSLFLAPTAFANHLFSFRRTGEGYDFSHQALDLKGLESYLSQCFQAWQGLRIEGKPKEVEEGRETRASFCGKCGQPIKGDQKFCGKCGSPI